MFGFEGRREKLVRCLFLRIYRIVGKRELNNGYGIGDKVFDEYVYKYFRNILGDI